MLGPGAGESGDCFLFLFLSCYILSEVVHAHSTVCLPRAASSLEGGFAFEKDTFESL